MKTKRWIPIVGIILVVILSSIFLAQGKKLPQTPLKESNSDFLAIPYDTTSVTSVYSPTTPVVVTVWIFPDTSIENDETFQIRILYNNKWVIYGCAREKIRT